MRGDGDGVLQQCAVEGVAALLKVHEDKLALRSLQDPSLNAWWCIHRTIYTGDTGAGAACLLLLVSYSR